MLWRSYPNFTRESKAKRRRRLLAEFLQERSARKQANAEEETSSQDLEIEVQNQVTLSYDLLFKIFILVPAESLFRLQFVCKMWFSLINSSIFIRCHSQQSETVLICKRLTLLKPTHYAAFPHVRPPGSEDKPRSYFHFLNLDHGDNNFIESSVLEFAVIRASYDGLILATIRNRKSLILMNPVTRKHIVLPLGIEDNFYGASFGIALCNQAYKVVHLFREKPGCIGCEILHVCTQKWTRIEGPPSELLVDIKQIPVSIGRSLNWMSSKQGCDYFVSMNVHEEKFISKKLPVSSSSMDQLLEIGGDLGFVTHPQLDLLQVWILITDGGSGENWIKRCSINTSVYFPFRSPICCLRNGKGIVLETKNEVYDYDFETGEMKLIQSRSYDEIRSGRINKLYIPHRNTLASWEDNLEVMY